MDLLTVDDIADVHAIGLYQRRLCCDLHCYIGLTDLKCKIFPQRLLDIEIQVTNNLPLKSLGGDGQFVGSWLDGIEGVVGSGRALLGESDARFLVSQLDRGVCDNTTPRIDDTAYEATAGRLCLSSCPPKNERTDRYQNIDDTEDRQSSGPSLF